MCVCVTNCLHALAGLYVSVCWCEYVGVYVCVCMCVYMRVRYGYCSTVHKKSALINIYLIYTFSWRYTVAQLTWLLHMCDMTQSYVWHDSFICVTWLLHMCDMTQSYVWHGSFIRVTWLIHTWDMTHSYVWHDSFICVTWLLYMCDELYTVLLDWSEVGLGFTKLLLIQTDLCVLCVFDGCATVSGFPPLFPQRMFVGKGFKPLSTRPVFSWWVLQHCIGFARLVAGRLRVYQAPFNQIDVCTVWMCVLSWCVYSLDVCTVWKTRVASFFWRSMCTCVSLCHVCHVCRVCHVCCVGLSRLSLSISRAFLDGYCSTVQGLLDWFEVDLGFTVTWVSSRVVQVLHKFANLLFVNVWKFAKVQICKFVDKFANLWSSCMSFLRV